MHSNSVNLARPVNHTFCFSLVFYDLPYGLPISLIASSTMYITVKNSRFEAVSKSALSIHLPGGHVKELHCSAQFMLTNNRLSEHNLQFLQSTLDFASCILRCQLFSGFPCGQRPCPSFFGKKFNTQMFVLNWAMWHLSTVCSNAGSIYFHISHKVNSLQQMLQPQFLK